MFNSRPLSFYFPPSRPEKITAAFGIKNYLTRLIAVVLTGLLAGLSGMVLALILHAFQHLAFGYSPGQIVSAESFLRGVTDSSWPRRLSAIVAGGAIAGFGWWLLGREVAPREMGALGAGMVARKPGLLEDESRTLIACGAGTGLAVGGLTSLLLCAAGAFLTGRILDKNDYFCNAAKIKGHDLP